MPVIVPADEPMLTIKEAAQRLGFHVISVYRLTGNGALESVMVGSARLIPESAVIAYKRAKRTQPANRRGRPKKGPRKAN